jgi:hypothetical protein
MLLLFTFFATVLCGRPVPEYEINLDLPPEQRFAAVLTDFNVSLTALYNDVLTKDPVLKKVLFDFVAQRGDENEELQGEIEGVAKACNLPVTGVHALQFLYELGTLMIPIENITIPWRGPGCTGIIAADKNGSVYHGRNLDFSPEHYMQKIVYSGKFTKGGKEVFRAQMMAGYSCVVTGMKMGANGFSYETNTRFPGSEGENKAMIHNLLVEKRALNGWTVRKVLETVPDFETAVQTLSTAKYVAPMYNIMSGVKKGAILARDPDSLAFKLTLGQSNPQCRSDYIIMTNFDFWWGDIREWFDPTAREIGHPRRLIAQAVLNATTPLTPEIISSALSTKGVLAFDTIFQAMINVEKGLWNLTLPDLTLSF